MTATDLHQRMLHLLDKAKAMSEASRPPMRPAAAAACSPVPPSPPRSQMTGPVPIEPPVDYGVPAAATAVEESIHIPGLSLEIQPGEPDTGPLDDINARGEVRQKVLRRGKITYQNYEIECQVRDLSSTGARLRLAGDVTVPSCFKLLILPEKITKQVQVCWRDELMLGVRFMED